MSEIINLTDETLDPVLNALQPVLFLLHTGEGVRGDFWTAFRKIAAEQSRVVIASVNIKDAPAAAARFEAGSKPVMISWANGEVIARRGRPWGSDVPAAVEALRQHIALPTTSQPTDTTNEEQPRVYNEPVNVTDETFQTEVLESDMPVLVDFWAEWCGPCKMVAPVLDKLAKEFEGKVKIAKVDVDNNPQLSQTFQIRSIPNMMAIKDKTIVFNQPGALPEQSLRDLIQQLIELEIPPREEAAEGEATD